MGDTTPLQIIDSFTRMKFLILALVALSLASPDPAVFLTNKIKTTINSLFQQTSLGVVSIPFFYDITLESFHLDDLSYSFEQYHKLSATVSLRGSALGAQIDNSFSVSMEFEAKDDQTIPVKYQFKVVNQNNDKILNVLQSQVNKALSKLIGKPFPYHLFASYIKLVKKEEDRGYWINFDVSEYMEQQKKSIEIPPEVETEGEL